MTPAIKLRLANKARGSFEADGNTLWLYDFIATDDEEASIWGGISPMTFIRALQATTGPVTLRLNSPGGSIFGAQAMVVAMRAHRYPIIAQVDSLAASAASVIAAEAAECVIARGAMIMIHRSWSVTVGNAVDHEATAGLLSKIDGVIAETYARRAAGAVDAERFMAMMTAETWLDADEAVAAGLADRIAEVEPRGSAPAWDLSAYAAAPWMPAPAASRAGAAPDGAEATRAGLAARNDRKDRMLRQLAVRLAVGHPI